MAASSRSSIINKATLEAVNKMVRALFIDSMEQSGPGPLMSALTMPFDSNQKSETHNWMKDYAILREWVGARQIAAMEGEGVTIVNKSYEATIGLSREDLIFDRTGLLQNRIKQLPESYDRGRRKILTELITLGHTTTGPGGAGYDGVAFFSAAHPNADLAVQSNLAATPSALDATNFDLARKQMRLLVNHKGEPMDISPDTLVIGPELEASAEILFNTRNLTTGGDNRHYNAIPSILVESRITDTSWYLFDSKHPVSPFIDQIVVPMELASQVDPENPRVFDYNEFAWGIYALFGIGYGLWQTAFRNAGV